PFLLEVQSCRRSVDGDFAERHARATTLVAHFLRRKIFLLSVETVRSATQAWCFQLHTLHPLVAEIAPLSGAESAEFRGVGKQSVRQTPLQHILQKLHRKSLGHELQGNLRRLGRTTDQR